MNKQQFTAKINFIFEDKNIEKPSIEWLNGLYDKCKNIDEKRFSKGVDKLISIPQDAWNKTYGFRGRPTIIDFVDSLSGERPLTDEQLLEEKRKYNQAMTIFVSTITNWINDPNIEYLFLNKYQAGGNEHLKRIINEFAGVKEPLADERIVKMGKYLKKLYDDDKNAFTARMLGISKEQNQFRFPEVEVTQQKQINFLPTLKRI